MTRITVDPELRMKLLDLSQPIDLCDESGKIIGMFMPINAGLPADDREPPLSEEEWNRRQQEPGYTTEELIARLKCL